MYDKAYLIFFLPRKRIASFIWDLLKISLLSLFLFRSQRLLNSYCLTLDFFLYSLNIPYVLNMGSIKVGVIYLIDDLVNLS